MGMLNASGSHSEDSRVDLFFYSTVSEENHKRLEDLLGSLLRKGTIEVYRNFDNLSQRLKSPAQSESIVVLAPGSREDLLQILSKRDLLRDLRVILIAPDHELETTAMAHQLRPRYLTYFNGDFEALAAVLNKMLKGYLTASFSRMSGKNKFLPDRREEARSQKR